MMSSENLEIEVKFLVKDLGNLRGRILSLGAREVAPRTYELNIRYDNAWQGLARQGKLLRLRQDSAARLTYKGAPDQMIESEARVREELEVVVEEFETMDALLKRVGFEPKQRYEKYRQTFLLEGVEIVLDELPFGDFIELEGDSHALRKVADRLELAWDRRILENYLVLMARLKALHDLEFDDLTFTNFAGLEISIAELYGAAA